VGGVKMKTNPATLLRSNELRKHSTPWETKLWWHLRNKNLSGFRFRRQFVIGPYITDFCCFAKKLVIELDGGQHKNIEQSKKDIRRSKYLESRGYKIIRFWNGEIENNLDEV
jgi:very-short-patch-repair endonuclease